MTLAKRGPKTEAGKLVASMNSTRHGILSPKPIVAAFESEYGWKTHRQAILDSLEPQGGVEQVLAERVALNSWRLNRVAVYETEKIAEMQENLIEEMRQDVERYPLLHAKDGFALEAADQVEIKRALYADVLAVLREKADEFLGSHHTMDWIYVQAPWFALELVGYQNDPHYDPDEHEDECLEASDALEENLRARLNNASIQGLSVADLRDTLEWLANEAGVGDELGEDGEVLYTPLEALLEKLATEAEVELNNTTAKAQEAERKILSKRRDKILPLESDLQKISRYEAHLSREMYKALHELEALQARRKGGAAPLARLDVQMP